MLAKEDIEYIRYLHKEGYSIREIMKETDIPRTAVHNVVSQRADPEGIDLLHARVEELEKLVKLQGEQLQSLLPKPKKDSLAIPDNLTPELKLEAFRKRQRELAEQREYS
jgi:predicted DNA-binding protein YlxM (UPF0122 family)